MITDLFYLSIVFYGKLLVTGLVPKPQPAFSKWDKFYVFKPRPDENRC